MPRRLSIWNAVSIDPKYQTMTDIADACLALKPSDDWLVEWLVKAGEGGSWQSEFDSHPLAVSGPEQLQALRDEAQESGVWVTPYYTIRGRTAWRVGETDQIAAISPINNRVVLNLEAGRGFWDGPTSYNYYISWQTMMWDKIMAYNSTEPTELEIATIPRQTTVNALGGLRAFRTWEDAATSMSWECYGLIAPDLRVDVAIPRANTFIQNKDAPQFLIAIVEQSDLANWCDTVYAQSDYGIQVWQLDGD